MMGGNGILKVQLLGQPKLFWNQEQIFLKRRTNRILLYFLAYRTESKLVARNQLMLKFWPDHPDEIARRNLRDLLSKLRKELPDEDIIQTDREWVWLDEKKVQVDVLEFEELYRQLNLPILVPHTHPLPEMIYQKMVYAINMWQAPRFMDGEKALEQEEILDWIDENNFRLNEKRLDLMTKLGRHFVLVGDYDQAVEWFDAVISEDEYFRFLPAHVFRLEAIFRLGRIAEAWDICETLKNDYSPDTFDNQSGLFTQLYQDIKNARENISVKVSAREHAARQTVVPYVGREELIHALDLFYQRGGVVFVEGEAGIGKTRLVTEAIKQFYPRPKVFNLTAYVSEKEIPFHPVLEFFQKMMKPDDWHQIYPLWAQQLVTIFPELMTSINLETIPGLIQKSENDQRLTLESLYQTFLYLVKDDAFVLVLDDAQWCDSNTLQLFSYLIEREFFFENGLLVLILRNEWGNENIALIQNNTHWMDRIGVIKIPLLNEAETTKITQNILKHPLPKTALKQFMADTNGNPLFIIETIRAFLASNIDLKNPENWTQIPLPAVIQILIRDQINALSVPAKQIVHEAAVLGLSFDLTLLKWITTLSENDLVIGLDELIIKGFLEVSTQLHQTNHYRFLKKRVRDVVLMDMGETKRQLVHSRIGKILDSLPETEVSLSLSHQKALHLTEAGEVQQAFEAWIKLANLAFDLNVWPKADEAFGMAKQLADIFPVPLSQQQLYQLYIGWGEAAIQAGNFSSANYCFQRAVVDGKRQGFYLLLAAGMRGQAHLYIQRNLPHQAHSLLENVFDLLQDQVLDELIKARFVKGLLFMKQNHIQSAVQEFKLALTCEPEHHQPSRAYYSAAFYAARMLSLFGEVDEAEKLAEKMLRELRFKNQRRLSIQAEFTCGYVYLLKGNYAKALFHFGSCVDLALSINLWPTIMDCWLNMSHLYLLKGQLFQAEDYIEKVEQLLKLNPTSRYEFILKLQQATLAIYLGEYKAAINILDQINQIQVNDDLKLMAEYLVSLAEFGQGEKDAAIYHMRDVLHLTTMSDNRYMEVGARTQLILMQYLKGISYQDLLSEIVLLSQILEETKFEGSGSLLQFIQYQEAVKHHAWEKAQASIGAFINLAQEQGVNWHLCFAAQLSEELSEKNGGIQPGEKINKEQILKQIFAGMPEDILEQKVKTCYLPWIALR